MAGPKKTHNNAQVSPLVDSLLTGAFFVLIGYCCYNFFYSKQNHSDLWAFFAFCALVYVAIAATEWFCAVFMRDIVSKRWLLGGSTPDPLGNKASFVKFIATAWQLVIHTSMAALEVYILWDEAWLSHPYSTFIPLDYEPKTSLRYFYILQIAIWIMTCISHRFNSDAHAHKDYVLMYVHHLATIALVAISFNNAQTRIGIVVLFLHDCSDIAIDLLKISNYLTLEGAGHFFITEFVYLWTMVSWFYMRLYYFPYYVIWKGTVWAMGIGDQGLSINGDIPSLFTIDAVAEPIKYNSTWWVGAICSSLLIVLFIMHIWWFILLARILIRLIKAEDIRKVAHEEYEGDGHHKLTQDQQQQQQQQDNNKQKTVPVVGGETKKNQ